MIDFIGIDLIEFHDVPVKNIDIQTGPSAELKIDIMLWDEEINDNVINKLIFGQLNYIKPERIVTEENSELEIYSFDYYLEGELFYGKMICLNGTGKPSLQIEFACRTVEIKIIESGHNNT